MKPRYRFLYRRADAYWFALDRPDPLAGLLRAPVAAFWGVAS